MAGGGTAKGVLDTAERAGKDVARDWANDLVGRKRAVGGGGTGDASEGSGAGNAKASGVEGGRGGVESSMEAGLGGDEGTEERSPGGGEQLW